MDYIEYFSELLRTGQVVFVGYSEKTGRPQYRYVGSGA